MYCYNYKRNWKFSNSERGAYAQCSYGTKLQLIRIWHSHATGCKGIKYSLNGRCRRIRLHIQQTSLLIVRPAGLIFDTQTDSAFRCTWYFEDFKVNGVKFFIYFQNSEKRLTLYLTTLINQTFKLYNRD